MILKPSANSTTLEVFSAVFLVVLGDFEAFQNLESDLPFLAGTLFILASSLLTVVALNLLIAILSDSYDKFIGTEHVASIFEKYCLLFELEGLMTIRSKKMLLGDVHSRFFMTLTLDLNWEEGALAAEGSSERIREKVIKIDRRLRELPKYSRSRTEDNFSRIAENTASTLTAINEKIERLESKIAGVSEKNRS